jgi:hypothetical protein
VKLPNFLEDADLNALRTRMGATELGSYRLSWNPHRFTVGELEELIHAGIDVRYIDEVRALPDRTLSYKDRRVVLYLRDVPVVRAALRPANEPLVYHVADCGIVRAMRTLEKTAPLAVSAREDGLFGVNLLDGELQSASFERLAVCEECLIELCFENYSRAMAPEERVRARRGFTMTAFFERYRRNLVAEPARA